MKKVIVHHTWSPTAAQYRGLSTWEGIRKYHMEERGWSDIAYHVGVAKNQIWLLRDTDGGGHKGYMKAAGAHCIGYNNNSMGIVLIGNFDEEDPMVWGYETLAWAVAKFIQEVGSDADDVYFHRQFANKTCPGTRMNLNRFRQDVDELLGGQPGLGIGDVIPALPKYRVVVGSDDIDECRPKVEAGHLYVLAEPFAKHLGKTVPAGVDVHVSGYAMGSEIAQALGYLTFYRLTSMGHRWYLKKPEWLAEDDG
jgi:hypothetical protein